MKLSFVVPCYNEEEVLPVTSEIFLKKLDEQQGVITLPIPASKRVFKLMNILLNETEHDMYHDSYVKSVLTEILVVILRNQNQKTGSYAGVKFKRIIDYVKENSREQITLVSVARKFFVSEAHLSRMFKSYVGVSPLEYIKTIKSKLDE